MTTHHTELPRDLPQELSSTGRQTVASLREQLRRMQTAGRADSPERISSGVAAMDRMLPDAGYLPGNLVEFVSDGDGDATRWMSLNLASTRAMKALIERSVSW